MGTSSGGQWKMWSLQRSEETKKLKYGFKNNLLLYVFTALILFSTVLCKQPKQQYNGETKRLPYKLREINDMYEYINQNNNHKILRPKRDIVNNGFNHVKSINYCTWNAPLNTKFLTPYYEENREVHGCASSEKTSEGITVHAIHLNTTARNILLTVEDHDNSSSGLILILHSSTPVNWRLSVIGEAVRFNHQPPNYSIKVYVSKESTLKNYQNIPIHVHNMFEKDEEDTIYENVYKKSSKFLHPDEIIASMIRLKWGALTTFSRISGANRISILLPQDEFLSRTCSVRKNNSGIETQGASIDSSSSTAASVAYMITKQPATGCFHEEMAGTIGSDVHVIDLQSAEETLPDTILHGEPPSTKKVIDNSIENSDDTFLPNVYLSLAPEGTSEQEVVMDRNLTLILNSRQKVKWYLESIDLSGKLNVISTNGPVYNYDLSPSQQLSIENNPLPAAFDQLWKAVVSKTNNRYPISYARIDKANVLTIIVPKRSKRRSPFTSSHPINIKDEDEATLVPEPKQTFITGPIFTQKKSDERIENHLRSYLSKICNQQRTVITIPINITKEYDVVGVHLNEAECVGTQNKTHWILTTRSTSCGSLNHFSGSHPMMENNVVLEFASGSQYSNLEVRLPFECRFCSGIQDMDSSDYSEEDCDDAEDLNPRTDPNEDEMYEMKVSLLVDPTKGNIASNTRLLLSERYSPAVNVKIGDQIVISTHFETSKADFISLAINKCWLSDHSASDQRTINNGDWLMYEGCSPNVMNIEGSEKNYNNVTLLSNLPKASGPSFTFDITSRHAHGMRNMYIKCLIGLCANIQGYGNFAKCVDPLRSCYGRKNKTTGAILNSDHIAPTAQQLILRGPLRVIPPISKSPTNVPPVEPTEIDLSPKVLSDFTNKNNINSGGSNQDDKTVLTNGENGKPPPMHHSHAVMVGVPLEIAIAVALASFVIGAALTGVLCCIHHKKSSPKMAWRNGEVIDPCTEGSELQSMIASPTLAPQLQHNSHQQPQQHPYNGRAVIAT